MEKNNSATDSLHTTAGNKSTTTYGDDVIFLKNYIDVIELTEESNNAKVAITAALQGRVMTSSAFGAKGRSYGWINKELFQSKETLEHINVFGGEERFWLGPEGGQYSIFFKKGTEFTLDNWYTPKLIDLEPFEVKSKTSNKVVFIKEAALTNYLGFTFEMGIQREVAILSKQEIQKTLGLDSLPETIKTVAYKTTNTMTNFGDSDWKKENGLLSIWMLGMYKHSPHTTIIIPYITGKESDLGEVVNDAYFGKVPSNRLVVKDNMIYFSGDGQYRSKIGLSPKRAKNIAGSYDVANGVLTLVKYNKPDKTKDYVNSMWEIQDKPFEGDVINAYNDGASSPGAKPLGPFYELETSSPALALKSGECATHVQLTCHMEADEVNINPIIKALFGVSIEDIKTAFL
ncbi:hypothetical protein Q4512_13565 [Oceanihabitans sp. 2_MG-2023]|uniref:DUF6786 family protein n=1 Tax=Oceanihabitans sp. 2_MG-2023 TaxID=3062661 RepID=UPI0026E22A4F|nr:DUF6786 family protein [Oceanihabitans sp. 2_MG-2023]MDO6597949.1 hypothetical protein [Oceanihabitans sp. 2_MG-2023]